MSLRVPKLHYRTLIKCKNDRRALRFIWSGKLHPLDCWMMPIPLARSGTGVMLFGNYVKGWRVTRDAWRVTHDVGNEHADVLLLYSEVAEGDARLWQYGLRWLCTTQQSEKVNVFADFERVHVRFRFHGSMKWSPLSLTFLCRALLGLS